MEDLCYRNEYKHSISQASKAALSSRLGKVLPRDENCNGKTYLVKSLYFDNIYNEILYEKLDGVPYREKFRIRCYNNDYSYIRLEKKVKEHKKGYKLSTLLTRQEANKIILGDINFLKNSSESIRREFYFKSKLKVLKPKILIGYERDAYTYLPGNTRVTLDSNIRSSIQEGFDFFQDSTLLEIEHKKFILEVKFDRFIPSIIRDLVQVNETSSASNSKYAAGRLITL
ncbi:polyphosphate polymerase domain-containing protein [Alkalibaculum sporogenes]|nr:polyphosphate polymerase domain-containing protein [Alkalibaculum sporogenes]